MFVVLELVVQFYRFILFTFLRQRSFALWLPQLPLRFKLFQFYNTVEHWCLVKLVNKHNLAFIWHLCVLKRCLCIHSHCPVFGPVQNNYELHFYTILGTRITRIVWNSRGFGQKVTFNDKSTMTENVLRNSWRDCLQTLNNRKFCEVNWKLFVLSQICLHRRKTKLTRIKLRTIGGLKN